MLLLGGLNSADEPSYTTTTTTKPTKHNNKAAKTPPATMNTTIPSAKGTTMITKHILGFDLVALKRRNGVHEWQPLSHCICFPGKMGLQSAVPPPPPPPKKSLLFAKLLFCFFIFSLSLSLSIYLLPVSMSVWEALHVEELQPLF